MMMAANDDDEVVGHHHRQGQNMHGNTDGCRLDEFRIK